MNNYRAQRRAERIAQRLLGTDGTKGVAFCAYCWAPLPNEMQARWATDYPLYCSIQCSIAAEKDN